MGVVYRLVNNDIKENDLKNNPSDLKVIPFNYGQFISNYKANDLEIKLESMIFNIIKIVADSYQIAYKINLQRVSAIILRPTRNITMKLY